MSAPNCKLKEMVFVKTTSPNPVLHGRIGTTVVFLGNRVLPCCWREHKNMWVVELANPVQSPLGPFRHVGIADADLFPIRPGPDPDAVDTSRPIEQGIGA